jgi:hypothetical protein
MKVLIIRTDGREETHGATRLQLVDRVSELIGARTLDTVNIFRNPIHAERFRMRRPVMFVDDDGYETEIVDHGSGPVVLNGVTLPVAVHMERKATHARKPMNAKATELYHAICKPGTTHAIVGDVAIVDDEDLA